MMDFYELKPYHLVMLHYLGVGDFNMFIYTPYAVEMNYPVHKSNFTNDSICSAYEVDKLCSTFCYNGLRNFVGLYNLLIEPQHLMLKSSTKVLSNYACHQMRLTESVQSIQLGFEEHQWNIRVKWFNGEAFFRKEWFEFVEAAKIGPGDVLAIQETNCASLFKVSVFDVKTVSDDVLFGGIFFGFKYLNLW